MASSPNNAQTKKYDNASPPRSLGPLSSLEEYVRPDWWRKAFNATYLKTDADVVDLCCGQGRHLFALACLGFCNLEGLDRSHYLIQKAKARAKKEGLGIKFREGDARKLPYPPRQLQWRFDPRQQLWLF